MCSERRLICLLFREERPEHFHVSRCLKSLGRGGVVQTGVGENGSGLGQRCSVLPRVEHEDRKRWSTEDPAESVWPVIWGASPRLCALLRCRGYTEKGCWGES